MQYLEERHLKSTKWIVQYIKGTSQLGIKYYSNIVNQLFSYTELDRVGDRDDQKSTFGHVFDLALDPLSSLGRSKKLFPYQPQKMDILM